MSNKILKMKTRKYHTVTTMIFTLDESLSTHQFFFLYPLKFNSVYNISTYRRMFIMRTKTLKRGVATKGVGDEYSVTCV